MSSFYSNTVMYLKYRKGDRMNYLDEYKKWCKSDEFDEETKKELKEIKDNPEEIEDRFYKELEFGTARNNVGNNI